MNQDFILTTQIEDETLCCRMVIERKTREDLFNSYTAVRSFQSLVYDEILREYTDVAKFCYVIEDTPYERKQQRISSQKYIKKRKFEMKSKITANNQMEYSVNQFILTKYMYDQKGMMIKETGDIKESCLFIVNLAKLLTTPRKSTTENSEQIVTKHLKSLTLQKLKSFRKEMEDEHIPNIILPFIGIKGLSVEKIKAILVEFPKGFGELFTQYQKDPVITKEKLLAIKVRNRRIDKTTIEQLLESFGMK